MNGRGQGLDTRASVRVGRWSLWLFDMDGTLTRAAHDFPAIKAALDLPADMPILEALEDLAEPEAAWRWQRLDEIEWEIAGGATRADGALELLEYLRTAGRRMGVITRNNKRSARRTLEVAGLAPFFPPDRVVARDDAAPKPSPEGVELLVRRNHARRGETVLVGDFEFDLVAAREAGVACVLVDGNGDAPWRDLADVSVSSLRELRHLVVTGSSQRAQS